MNTPLRTALASALFAAGCIAGVSAQAADNGSGTGAAPSRDQVQQNGQSPNAGTMDDNAQRAHSPSQTKGDKSATKNNRADASTSSSGKTAMSDSSSAGNGESRNWQQIDADHDNSVSPDEMQKFLDAKWAANKGASKGDASSSSSSTSTSGATSTDTKK